MGVFFVVMFNKLYNLLKYMLYKKQKWQKEYSATFKNKCM